MTTSHPEFAEEVVTFFRTVNQLIKNEYADILAENEYLSKSVPEISNILFYKVYTPLHKEIETAIWHTETINRTVQQPEQLDVLFAELKQFNKLYQNNQITETELMPLYKDREEIIGLIQNLLKRILDVIVKLPSWLQSVLLILHAMLNMLKETMLNTKQLGD